MSKTIDIRGVIVPDDDQWIYDWFDITATCPRMVRDALREANGEDVEVLVNSGGGDVWSGQEIYTILRSYTGHVLIKIQSMAASAAAVLSMAGESEISPVAQLMIHNVKAGARGDHNDMSHAAGVLVNSDQALAAAFVDKTGKSEEEILALMERETWFTAEQAVKEGFVDRVMFQNSQTLGKPVQLAASIDSGLLPVNVIDYARKHFNKRTAEAVRKAKAEYEFLRLRGEAK